MPPPCTNSPIDSQAAAPSPRASMRGTLYCPACAIMPRRLDISASRTSSGMALNPCRVSRNLPNGSANTSPLVAAASVASSSISHSCGLLVLGA